MKALVYTDAHAAEGEDRLRGDPTVPLQRWRISRLYADLYQVYHDFGCEALIDLGDTTTDRNAIPLPTLQVISSGLEAIRPNPLLSFKLVGNHEQTYKNASLHSGSIYRRYHRVVDAVEVIDVGPTRIVLAAFPASEADLTAWLLEVASRGREKPTLLLGHFQVAGSLLNSGPSQKGVPLEAVSSFTAGLLGHVHKPQRLAGTNVHYLGTPFQQDFGEAHDEKRVVVVDLETLELTWVTLPTPFPRYFNLSLDSFLAFPDPWEHRFRVVLKNPAEAEEFYRHPRARLAEPVYGYGDSHGSHEGTQVEAAPLTLSQLLEEYVRQHPIDGVDISAAALFELGSEIVQSA